MSFSFRGLLESLLTAELAGCEQGPWDLLLNSLSVKIGTENRGSWIINLAV
jgi:hypothetical protein